MHIQVQKWGERLVIQIPESFARDFNIKQGSIVDISFTEGKVVVTPIAEPEYTLDQLLAGVTEQNLHREVDTGDAVGREFW